MKTLYNCSQNMIKIVHQVIIHYLMDVLFSQLKCYIKKNKYLVFNIESDPFFESCLESCDILLRLKIQRKLVVPYN